EGRGLVVVQQGEGVRGGADRAQPPAAARLEVGGAGKPCHHRRPGRRGRRLFVCPPAAHLQAGPVTGGGGHPRSCRRDGRIVVQYGQHQGLQQDAFGKRGDRKSVV